MAYYNGAPVFLGYYGEKPISVDGVFNVVVENVEFDTLSALNEYSLSELNDKTLNEFE